MKLIEAFNEPVIIVDSNARLLHANIAAKLLMPLKMGELLKIDEALYFSLTQAEMTPHSRIIEPLAQSRRKFIVDISPLEGGQRLLHFKDITKEAQLDKIRADFVANASHELRTPLSSLTGFIETLQTTAKGDAAAQEMFLPIMQEQAERMARLIDDLLSLSRIEMQEHSPPRQGLHLLPLLESCVATLSHQAKNIAITMTNLTQNDFVLGESDELMRLFENIIENALKYGASGAKIDITLEQATYNEWPALLVRVRDYGQGLEAKHLPRLTERFYRVDSAKKNSTGLGLAIVKHIVAHHRGKLDFKSELGKGLEVNVTLPLHKTVI